MRPRRIARRFLARAKHWGTPHVHCPACGGDRPVPVPDVEQICFVCHVRFVRLELRGDDAADWSRVRAQVSEWGAEDGPGGTAGWAAVWRPLLVDCPTPDGGKRTETLDSVFVYGL